MQSSSASGIDQILTSWPDNGNVILDVWNLDFTNTIELEKTLNNITGVVTNRFFALRPANILLLDTTEGVKKF